MSLKRAKSWCYLMVLLGSAPLVEASPRVQWVRDQGYPYVLTYKEYSIVAKYCYGEVEDILSDKKSEILCRAMQDGKCPIVSICYENRAIDGVIR
ncbi:MAG: hypothetical protein HYV97_19955 [Bdellovibrio sp.]|nr:hypothetical protein [Bdellovibrio sp.]